MKRPTYMWPWANVQYVQAHLTASLDMFLRWLFEAVGISAVLMLLHEQLGSNKVSSLYWIHFTEPPPHAVSPKMCPHTAGLKADKVKGLVNLRVGETWVREWPLDDG